MWWAFSPSNQVITCYVTESGRCTHRQRQVRSHRPEQISAATGAASGDHPQDKWVQSDARGCRHPFQPVSRQPAGSGGARGASHAPRRGCRGQSPPSKRPASDDGGGTGGGLRCRGRPASTCVLGGQPTAYRFCRDRAPVVYCAGNRCRTVFLVRATILEETEWPERI